MYTLTGAAHSDVCDGSADAPHLCDDGPVFVCEQAFHVVYAVRGPGVPDSLWSAEAALLFR